MPETDPTFVYRVSAIALDGDRVLLHRAEGDDFWSLPGGKVEPSEWAQDALAREMREELGCEVRVERLVWVVENFFEYAGEPFHELGLFFLITTPSAVLDHPVGEPFSGKERFYGDKELVLVFQWYSLEDMEGLVLYPTFLKTSLKAVPDGIEHIAQRDP
jgi:ADP-ribose pyrophosphatase YjhB (NUDIX family)